MKRLKGDFGEKRRGVEVDEARQKGPEEGSASRRGNAREGCRSRENNHRRVALLYFLAAIIERASGITKVKIKIKMRCRG